MDTFKVIISGFGGQGVLLAGQLLAYAGMLSGKQVAWVPSYGAEMRGGTANCSVIISSGEISSPLVEEADAVLAFNGPSLDKFEPALREGGLLLMNTSMVTESHRRRDVRAFGIPANELAVELGNVRVANIIMLGALAELETGLSFESITEAIRMVLPERHHHLLPLNQEALRTGAESIKAEVGV